jgi:hypothetical protein
MTTKNTKTRRKTKKPDHMDQVAAVATKTEAAFTWLFEHTLGFVLLAGTAAWIYVLAYSFFAAIGR